MASEEALPERRRRHDDPGFHEKRRIALVRQKARFYIESVRENLVSALPNRGELTRAEQDERIRNPRWIQSDAQLEFLVAFAARCAAVP